MKVAGLVAVACVVIGWQAAALQRSGPRLGQEVAVPRHLQDGEELKLSAPALVAFGRALFEAQWTDQDGGGRPLSKGTGRAVSDPAQPLKGSRAFNRISGPDANSCQGCHNAPYGITGGGGDFVTSGFEQADRFDFVTFEPGDTRATRGALDESKQAVSLQTVGHARSTPGLFGAGYLEMLARQMTDDLQRIRDQLAPGESRPLVSKGVSFGSLARRADGRWDVSGVQGLSEPSVAIPSGRGKPSLVIRPWQQAGRAVSLREVTNDALNRHHGIQSIERFGSGTDPDGDGIFNEMTRADVTALTVFQAVLPVPGRVIANDRDIERAVWNGEQLFERIGCSTCHVPALPLDRNGWIYSEPNPYNPEGHLQPRNGRGFRVDLADASLPVPRLRPSDGQAQALQVPAYTDFRLHDIADADAPATDRRFLTRRLWGAANEPPYFHDGRFTTMRQAVLAHAGEAQVQRRAFEHLSKYDQDSVIEFLKSLQVLPPGTSDLVVDEHYRRRDWPPRPRIGS